MKRNIKLNIAYDGSRYLGFQRLGDNDNTIQEKLEKCLSRLLAEDIKIIGSSRTDAGVHALDQVVNFYTDNEILLKELHEGLNRYLPEDIIIVDINEVSEKFHSRYWIDNKTYLYRIYTDCIPPLFERKYVYNLGKQLDINKMKVAAQFLIGEKDFQGFCKRKMKKSTIRTIYDINICEKDSEVDIYITANGFLYNMVRIIIGTLIEIGLNKREVNSINEILEKGLRADAGYLVPAEGLILYKNYFIDKK